MSADAQSFDVMRSESYDGEREGKKTEPIHWTTSFAAKQKINTNLWMSKIESARRAA